MMESVIYCYLYNHYLIKTLNYTAFYHFLGSTKSAHHIQ